MKLIDRLRTTDKPFFGHQRPIARDGSWHLETLIGQRGAIFGFPLADIFPLAPYQNKDNLSKWVAIAKSAYDSGMIIEFDWHAKHPGMLGNYKNEPGTNKTIKTCLESDLFYQHLDYVAKFFLAIESEGVEYLFRLFHEMNLSAFWWGCYGADAENTPDDYHKLYRKTVDYLRGKGCKPLFVFAPNFRKGDLESQYTALYPGDDYVDVCGLDWYYPNPMEGIENAKFLNNFASAHGKVLAFTECGCKLGGFKKLTPEQKTNYFPSLLEFMGEFDFSYIRFWTEDYLPSEEPELTLFKSQFIPNLQLTSPTEDKQMAFKPGILEFGGGSDGAATLVPNTSRIRNIQGKTAKGADKKLVFKNTGSAPLTVVLPTKGRDGNGGFVTLPYSFSVNGVPLGDKALVVPAGETLEFTAEKGKLTSIDGKTPEITKESYLIPDAWLPVFSKSYGAGIISSTLVEAEADPESEE